MPIEIDCREMAFYEEPPHAHLVAMPRLVVLRFAHRELRLREGTYVIGRGAECDITLTDDRVSRHHAVLRVDETMILLNDTGSKHGTRVNDEVISGPRVLTHGDRLRLGHTTLVVITGGERGLDAESVAPPAMLRETLDEAPDEPSDETTGEGQSGEDSIVRALGIGEGSAADEEELDVAARHAISLAIRDQDAVWLRQVFDAHAARRLVLQGGTLDLLRDRAAALLPACVEALGLYVDILQSCEESLSVPERVRLRRLEGLLRGL